MINFECTIFNGYIFVLYIKYLDLFLICFLSIAQETRSMEEGMPN